MRRFVPCSLFLAYLNSCSRYDGYGPMGGPGGARWPMMHYGYGGFFMWIIVIALIGVLIYLFIKTQKGKAGSTETPLEILKKRYARGEITKEDFDRMKKDLET